MKTEIVEQYFIQRKINGLTNLECVNKSREEVENIIAEKNIAAKAQGIDVEYSLIVEESKK